MTILHEHGFDYTIVPWDSEYLNNTTIEIIGTSSIQLNEIQHQFQRLLKIQASLPGDLFVCKLPIGNADHLHSWYKAGFYWVEQTVTLLISLNHWSAKPSETSRDQSYTLAVARADDLPAIRRIAHTTFTADRFHQDPHLSATSVNSRFEGWIDRSFASTDTVYRFADSAGVICGFFITNETLETPQLRLAGLDPTYIGKGMGKLLYSSMYSLLQRKGFQNLEAVISFTNIPVLNVYMYLGQAKCTNPRHVLHYVV